MGKFVIDLDNEEKLVKLLEEKSEGQEVHKKYETIHCPHCKGELQFIRYEIRIKK